MDKYTMWIHPKIGLLIAGFLALQFLHCLVLFFRKLCKTDFASEDWREVHSCGFKCWTLSYRAPEWMVEHVLWLPSLSSGSELSLNETESNLLAATISPFMMCSNWATQFSTLNQYVGRKGGNKDEHINREIKPEISVHYVIENRDITSLLSALKRWQKKQVLCRRL